MSRLIERYSTPVLSKGEVGDVRPGAAVAALTGWLLAMCLLIASAPLFAQDTAPAEPVAEEPQASTPAEPVLVPATTPMPPKDEDEDEEPPERVEDFDPTEEVNADLTLDFPVDV